MSSGTGRQPAVKPVSTKSSPNPKKSRGVRFEKLISSSPANQKPGKKKGLTHKKKRDKLFQEKEREEEKGSVPPVRATLEEVQEAVELQEKRDKELKEAGEKRDSQRDAVQQLQRKMSPEMRRRLGYPEENLSYGPDVPFEQVFRVFHNAEVGHHGAAKTAAMMRAAKVRRYDLMGQVCKAIAKCEVCQKTRSSHSFRPAYASLAESSPFKSVHLDHITCLPETLDGFNHILVMIDSFTGFTCLKACKSLEAAEVVTALEELFGRFGGPMEIRSDNHQSFNAVLLAAVCAQMNVRRRFSTAYVSTSNGMVERMNQEVQRYLSGFRMEQYGVNWVRNLPLVEHVIILRLASVEGFLPSC